jgi:hypothetical protein
LLKDATRRRRRKPDIPQDRFIATKEKEKRKRFCEAEIDANANFDYIRENETYSRFGPSAFRLRKGGTRNVFRFLGAVEKAKGFGQTTNVRNAVEDLTASRRRLEAVEKLDCDATRSQNDSSWTRFELSRRADSRLGASLFSLYIVETGAAYVVIAEE